MHTAMIMEDSKQLPLKIESLLMREKCSEPKAPVPLETCGVDGSTARDTIFVLAAESYLRLGASTALALNRRHKDMDVTALTITLSQLKDDRENLIHSDSCDLISSNNSKGEVFSF